MMFYMLFSLTLRTWYLQYPATLVNIVSQEIMWRSLLKIYIYFCENANQSILCDPGLKPSGDIFYKKGETNTTHSGIVNRELQLETKGHRCFWEQVASVLICIVIFDLKPCEMMRSKPLLCKLWAWSGLNGRFASCYFHPYRNANILLVSALEEFPDLDTF